LRRARHVCDQPDRGVKDWSWIIAVDGGMLDRLDSVIFAAPIFFHLTRYWWTV
jgi:phosphatidate cytidylyltransferase